MTHYLPHEKLEVYGVALKFAALADEFLSVWPSAWAVQGQFDRAVESLVTNLVKAARLRATDAGVYGLVGPARISGEMTISERHCIP